MGSRLHHMPSQQQAAVSFFNLLSPPSGKINTTLISPGIRSHQTPQNGRFRLTSERINSPPGPNKALICPARRRRVRLGALAMRSSGSVCVLESGISQWFRVEVSQMLEHAYRRRSFLVCVFEIGILFEQFFGERFPVVLLTRR